MSDLGKIHYLQNQILLFLGVLGVSSDGGGGCWLGVGLVKDPLLVSMVVVSTDP